MLSLSAKAALGPKAAVSANSPAITKVLLISASYAKGCVPLNKTRSHPHSVLPAQEKPANKKWNKFSGPKSISFARGKSQFSSSQPGLDRPDESAGVQVRRCFHLRATR